ncbi:hypothetical protein B5V02_34365 [Mesorhizobium kowhaii]|uniref:Uncharacterized protein n=1 Tax=Mesorhizobium kowhaii TaxID=1300272 RepID=A0A2W7BVV9_9HYPH|nr:hypothetical protein B5V02_34365 [Mesorhizobium kowhaii]
MTNRPAWVYIATAGLSLIVAVLAIVQAITLAWLSAFAVNEPRLASLNLRFWMFLIIGGASFVVCAVAVIRWVRQENEASRKR